MNIRTKIYHLYDNNILPKIDHIRSSTRLAHVLRKIAEIGLDKIDEQDAESIFEKGEWDNLFILDACRHDLYEEVEGPTESRITLGSSSAEFITKTFSEGDYEDTVVVTANPHFEPSIFEDLTGRDPEEVFHTIYYTYRTDWDDEKGTVMPEPMIRDAKNARKLFPDKRLIVHFMQPHYPFIESDLEEIGIRPDLDKSKEEESVWEAAQKGKYSQKEVWEAYRKNLDFILAKAKKSASELEGKTFLTSDHGNLAGENGLYGHPSESKAKSLRKVPWTGV